MADDDEDRAPNQEASTPKGSVTVVKALGRILPIILVPGVMGSRLRHVASDTLVWNPLGKPAGGDAWKREPLGPFATSRIRNIDAELEPARHFTHLNDPFALTAKAKARHFERSRIHNSYEIVWPSYQGLLLGLDGDLRDRLGKLGWQLHVDCFGYDWRLSNRDNARKLANRVDTVMAACGGERPVLVCHSMGGLVARSFLWGTPAGAKRVRGLVLVGSPTLGATKPYCFLKAGIPSTPGEDPDLYDPVMAFMKFALLKLVKPKIFNKGRHADVAFLRECFALQELMVKRLYARHENVSWLTFDPSITGLDTTASLTNGRPPQTGEVLLNAENTKHVYNDPSLGFMDFPFDRNGGLWSTRELALKLFDNELFTFTSAKIPARVRLHKVTIFYVSKVHKTHDRVHCELDRVTHSLLDGENTFKTTLTSTASENAGDNSVPYRSALPNKNIRFPKPGKGKYRVLHVASEHGQLCNDTTVVDDFVDLMERACKRFNQKHGL